MGDHRHSAPGTFRTSEQDCVKPTWRTHGQKDDWLVSVCL